MTNKTIIIDNNQNSLKKLTALMQQTMPQLNLIGTFNKFSEGYDLLKKEQPKLLFINIEHLDAQAFLQLQKMNNTTCSIIFITPKNIEENLKHLPTQLMETKTAQKQHIRLKIDDTTQFVDFKNIIRLEAQGNYTLFHLSNRTKPVICSRTLKYYIEKLGKEQFVRPHQSHLVNKNFIQNIISKNGKYVVLKDGTEIKVSRRRASELSLI